MTKEDANVGGEATAKKKVRRTTAGKKKSLFHLYKIVDANGTVIDGAKLQTILLTRDPMKVMDAQGKEENRGAVFDSTTAIV